MRVSGIPYSSAEMAVHFPVPFCATNTSEMSTHEYEMSMHEYEMSTHEYEMSTHEYKMSMHEYEMSMHEYEMSTHEYEMSTHEYEMSMHEYEMSTHEYTLEVVAVPLRHRGRHLPLPPHRTPLTCPAVSRILSTRFFPSVSLNLSTSREISIRYESSSPLFHSFKTCHERSNWKMTVKVRQGKTRSDVL